MESDDIKCSGFNVPEYIGYKEQVIDSCGNCRFGCGDEEGCEYCMLYVNFISVKFRPLDFAHVTQNGICKHYKREKKHYDLGGTVSMNKRSLFFGESFRDDD
jgi:hypothetical protein